MAQKQINPNNRKKIELRIKFYIDHIFSALITDLQPIDDIGLPTTELYESIIQILNAISGASDEINDGHIAKKYFSTRIDGLIQAFENWYREPHNKGKKFAELKDLKREEFRQFKNEWAEMEAKSEDFSKLLEEFLRVQSISIERAQDMLKDLTKSDAINFRNLRLVISKFQ